MIDFLLKDWSTPTAVHLNSLRNKELFLTVRALAFSITLSNGTISVNPVTELESQQEEADTKMFLCAQHAQSLGFQSANIVTVDSDVAILSLFYQSRMDISLSLEYGTGNKTNIFDIGSNTVEEDLKYSFPGLHALTGCDSTSCFRGQGKIKSLKILRSDERFVDAAKLLGEYLELSPTVKEVLEELTCRLYGVKEYSEVNNARYELFYKSRSDPQRLPPTQDAVSTYGQSKLPMLRVEACFDK